MKINNKLAYLAERLNDSNNKVIYGYRTHNDNFVIYNKKEGNFFLIEGEEVTGNTTEIPGYVKNINALFKKFPQINFVILEKTSDKKIDKETALKVNEKISEYIKNNLESGKIEIEETGSNLYYSNKLQDLKI